MGPMPALMCWQWGGVAGAAANVFRQSPGWLIGGYHGDGGRGGRVRNHHSDPSSDSGGPQRNTDTHLLFIVLIIANATFRKIILNVCNYDNCSWNNNLDVQGILFWEYYTGCNVFRIKKIIDLNLDSRSRHRLSALLSLILEEPKSSTSAEAPGSASQRA